MITINNITQVRVGDILKTFDKRTPNRYWIVEVYKVTDSNQRFAGQVIEQPKNGHYHHGEEVYVTSSWFWDGGVVKVLNR